MVERIAPYGARCNIYRRLVYSAQWWSVLRPTVLGAIFIAALFIRRNGGAYCALRV